MKLGEAIRHLRERHGLSARALSILCGFSPAYIGKVESGELEPSFKAFAKMAIVLRMTDQEILFLVVEEAKR